MDTDPPHSAPIPGPPSPQTPEKSRFWDQDEVIRPGHSTRYSTVVRWMRLVLPLIALCVVGVLFAWPRMEEAMSPVVKEAASVPEAARNEVLNPRFESVDSSNQPFAVTADRAVQSLKDPDLVLLDKPAAEVKLTSGRVLSGRAERGAYKQKDENLWLEGDVRLMQDEGYELGMEKLLINLRTQQAWSDRPVQGKGPAGTIAATGLQLDNAKGHLVFTGPVKLVLTDLKGL